MAAPVVLGLEIGAATTGLMSLIGNFVVKKTTIKAEKHLKIKMLASAKLDTIASHISKAMMCNYISDEEFKLIMEELNKYKTMKEEIRSNSKKKLKEEEEESLIEKERQEARESFRKLVGKKIIVKPYRFKAPRFRCRCVVGANLNSGDIRINIETQDIFTHPCESFLLIEGQLSKNNDTLYADADAISLINNGMMYLFKNIKYQLTGQEIESILNPGQATTMLGLLKYPDDFSKSQGLNQLWYKDTSATAILDDSNIGFMIRHNYIINSPVPKGTFSFRIPLKHIFGFCGDYNKILYGIKQTLTLHVIKIIMLF